MDPFGMLKKICGRIGAVLGRRRQNGREAQSWPPRRPRSGRRG
jgi:hypothetical protein